jgi:hypothetical protein
MILGISISVGSVLRTCVCVCEEHPLLTKHQTCVSDNTQISIFPRDHILKKVFTGYRVIGASHHPIFPSASFPTSSSFSPPTAQSSLTPVAWVG